VGITRPYEQGTGPGESPGSGGASWQSGGESLTDLTTGIVGWPSFPAQPTEPRVTARATGNATARKKTTTKKAKTPKAPKAKKATHNQKYLPHGVEDQTF
jgi:hypothetical protein